MSGGSYAAEFSGSKAAEQNQVAYNYYEPSGAQDLITSVILLIFLPWITFSIVFRPCKEHHRHK